MTISEHREKLKAARQQILEQAPRVAEEMAVSALSIVKRRSIENGIYLDGKEGDYAEYSTNEYSTSLLKGKELNASGRAYIDANKVGNWKGFRQAQGLKSERVNLAYSNRMWTGLQVIKTEQVSESLFRATVGAVGEEVKKVVSDNVDRYGRFFDPTEDEMEVFQGIALNRIEKILLSALG